MPFPKKQIIRRFRKQLQNEKQRSDDDNSEREMLGLEA